MKIYRLLSTLLAIIVIACLSGVQGQFESSIGYSTAPSVAQYQSPFSSCYYNQWGQYVCNNYPYYTENYYPVDYLGDYYPWDYLGDYYNTWDYYPWNDYAWPYYSGYSLPAVTNPSTHEEHMGGGFGRGHMNGGHMI